MKKSKRIDWRITINKFFAQHVKPAASVNTRLDEQILFIAYHEWRSQYQFNARYVDQYTFMRYVNEHEFDGIRVVRYNKYAHPYLNVELVNMEEIYVSNVIGESVDLGELK